MGDEAEARRTYERLIALETQPVNTVRAIDSQIDIDDSYAYAHYEVGRVELQTLRRTHDPKLFLSVQRHFLRTLAVIADYHTGGNRMDQMFKQLGQPRVDRERPLMRLEAKTRLRLAEAFEAIGQPKGAQDQREAEARSFAKDPDPAASLAAVEKDLAEEDAEPGS